MICYEFEDRFVSPTLEGTKRITLRRGSAMHDIVVTGETIALISGPLVIGFARVFSWRMVTLTVRKDGAAMVSADGFMFNDEDEEARLDGFADEWDMGRWYVEHYKLPLPGSIVLARIEFALNRIVMDRRAWA